MRAGLHELWRVAFNKLDVQDVRTCSNCLKYNTCKQRLNLETGLGPFPFFLNHVLPMSNSRAYNQLADSRIRASKRRRIGVDGSYHDRVVEEQDYEVVNARESRLSSRRRNIETPRSPQKGRTAWVVGDMWVPEDDSELGLDPGGNWCDEEFEKDVMDSPRPLEKPVLPKKRTKVSVRYSPLTSTFPEVSYLCRDDPMWFGRRSTGRLTSTRCCGGREGAIFDRPPRAPTVAEKSSQGSQYTAAWIVFSPTLYVSDAAFVVTEPSPSITSRLVSLACQSFHSSLTCLL